MSITHIAGPEREAERLTAQAIAEEKNLVQLVEEILERGAAGLA